MSQANQRRGHLPGGIVERGFSNTFYILLHSTFVKKSPTFCAKVGGPEIGPATRSKQWAGHGPRPARPIGSAASVYSEHIDQPEVLVHC